MGFYNLDNPKPQDFNRLSLADRQHRSCAYKLHTLEILFELGKYTMKVSRQKGMVNDSDTLSITPATKRRKCEDTATIQYRCISPVWPRNHLLCGKNSPHWSFEHDDDIWYCKKVQTCAWLSFNWHRGSFSNIERHYILRMLHMYNLDSPSDLRVIY